MSDSDSDAGGAGPSGAPPPAADGLSAYERQRLDNIEKNKRVLESLGLLDGGGLIQKKSTIRREPKEPKEKPVVEKRERTQRAVKKVERLDPGADRLRKLTARGLHPDTGPSEPTNPDEQGYRPIRRAATTTSDAEPRDGPYRKIDYGLSDATIFRRFYGSAMTSAFVYSAPPPAATADADDADDEQEEERDEPVRHRRGTSNAAVAVGRAR